jgi:hypothetical protein
MNCCTTVATSNIAPLHELGTYPSMPVWGAASFSHTSAVSVALVLCVLTRCHSVVNLQTNVHPEDPSGALICNSFAWPRPRFDAGRCFPHSPSVKLQQPGADSVLDFSEKSAYERRGRCLQLAQTWPKFWLLYHCMRPV